MSAILKVAVVQMRSGFDPWENLLLVDGFVKQATEEGCQMVCFPENSLYRGPKNAPPAVREESLLALDRVGRLEITNAFSDAVKPVLDSWKITVCLGSVFEKSNSGLPFNSHWVVQPGRGIQAYQKMHLFDYQGTDAYHESSDCARGLEPMIVEVDGWRVGLSICFDLRFPELYRFLSVERGAEVLLVPSSFTYETGKRHWHALLKARAIENLAYVLAPAQWGTHNDSRGQHLRCFGHACAYEPWGDLLCEAPEEGDVMKVVELDKTKVEKARRSMPSLSTAQMIIQRR